MDGNSGGHIELVFVSKESGQIDINIPYLNISTTLSVSQGQTKYSIPKDIIPDNLHVQRKGVEIHATVPITVFAMNVEGFNTDGYAVIPVDKLGNEYFIPSTAGENEMTILSPYGSNNVNIKLRLPSYASVRYNGKTYRNGDTLSISLEALGTFEINAYSPIAGTKISSSKPLAVVSGDRCTHLEGGGMRPSIGYDTSN